MTIKLIILFFGLITYVYCGKSLMITVNAIDTHFLNLITKDTEGIKIITYVAPQNFSNKDLSDVCAMGRPDLLLDFTRGGISSESIKKYARHMQIPTITTSFGDVGDIIEWKNLTAPQKAYLVQIKRPEDILPDMIRYIVIKNKYKDAGILYDNSFYMMHKLKRLLINLDVRHSIQPLDERKFKHMDKIRIFNFFIVADLANYKYIINIVCEARLYTAVYSFYIITIDHGSYYWECDYVRYVVTRPDLGEWHLRNGLASQFHFDIIQLGMQIAKMIPTYPNFTKCPAKKIDYMGSRDNKTDLYKLIKEVIAMENRTLKYELNGERNVPIIPIALHGIELYKLYMKEEVVGSWTSANGGQFINAGRLKEYASRIVYIIAVAVQEPFVFPDENSIYNYSGICVDLIHEISIREGFSFYFYRPEIKYYRSDFDQVLKDVEEGKAHIAIGSISVTPEREYSNVLFTIPFYESVGQLIMMKIPEASRSYFKIIQVLHIGVWVCVVVTFFITSAMLWIIDRWSPYSYQNTLETLDDSEEGRIFTVKESLWFCLTSITSLGGGESPRSLSGRILTGSWWLFGFMIIASYTANLSAFLTASYLESSIESLEDLFNQQKVKYGVINNSKTMQFFDNIAYKEGKAMKMWLDNILNSKAFNVSYHTLDYPINNEFTRVMQHMRKSNLLLQNFDNAVEMVQASTSNEKFAFIGDASDIKFAKLTNCDLQSAGEEFAKNFYAFAIRNDSHLKEPLDNAIIDFMNNRVLENFNKKWWRENPKAAKCNTDKYQSEGITLQNIVGVFVLIGGGVVIAFVINMIERLLEKIYKTKSISPIIINNQVQK